MADAIETTTEVETKQPDAAVWAKEEMKKAFAARDAAKAEAKALKDAKDEAERKALEESNQYKTLYEKSQGEIKRLAELEARIKDIDERADTRIAQLAEKLADDAKAEYKEFISALDRDKRLEWLTAKTTPAAVPKESPAGERATGIGVKDPATMTHRERAEWAMRDPEGFKRAMGK